MILKNHVSFKRPSKRDKDKGWVLKLFDVFYSMYKSNMTKIEGYIIEKDRFFCKN